MTRSFTLALAIAVGALTFCGCRPVRFADRAILWHDPDDRPIPMPHARPDIPINWEGARDAIFQPADHLFGLEYGKQAENVNALDEVPDSSWYSDPRRDPRVVGDPAPEPLAPEAIARGAATEEPPVPPYTIRAGKSIGSAPGFVVDDARGRRYLFKLDPAGRAGLVTSTEVVSTRLAWASGWRVPSETIVRFSPSELVLPPDVTRHDQYDHEVLFTRLALDQMLSAAGRVGGNIQAVASRWLPGRTVGEFSWFGRVKDDPNDRVDHEDRRDLRGFGIFAAWIDDTDTLQNNTLDTYLGAPGDGHVVHWQQDVGGSMGVFAADASPFWMGRESYFQPGRILGSFFSLGAMVRPWEGERVRAARDRLVSLYPELGFFDVAHFAPRDWHPILENPAFVRQTARDRYWGAKRVIAFRPDELKAAISAGRYRPVAAERLFQVLWGRRQKIAQAFLGESAPLDYFQLEGDRLCFDDLWLSSGLGGKEGTSYLAREPEESQRALPISDGGRDDLKCVALAPKDGYRIIELRVSRPGQRHFGRPVRVHLVEHAGRRHLIGIER
ncbi:MAG TPA: hypothetical protein VII38_23730 [Polyangia bacterium]